MPWVNLITAETQGVDMKSNPLFLGKERLVSSTNMMHQDGVIKTRPGFRYQSLGLRGQFQGVTAYSPSKGLSYRPFSPPVSGLISAVSGELHVNDTTHGKLSCHPKTICGSGYFRCAGDVTLFQAENYLIAQSPQTNTYWWNGEDCLVESPGLQGPEEVCFEFDPPTIEAPQQRPPCPIDIRIIILDKLTNLPLPGASIKFLSEFRRRFESITNAQGVSDFNFHAGNYTYGIGIEDYEDLVGSFVFDKAGTYYFHLTPIPGLIPVKLLVRDSESLQPLADTRVKIRGTGNEKIKYSNSIGVIEVLLLPGFHSYNAFLASYVEKDGSFNVSEPVTVPIDLVKNPDAPPIRPPVNPPYVPPDPPDPGFRTRRVLYIQVQQTTDYGSPIYKITPRLNGYPMPVYEIPGDGFGILEIFATQGDIETYSAPPDYESISYPRPPQVGARLFNQTIPEEIPLVGRNTLTFEIDRNGPSGGMSFEIWVSTLNYGAGNMTFSKFVANKTVNTYESEQNPEIVFDLNYTDIFVV